MPEEQNRLLKKQALLRLKLQPRGTQPLKYHEETINVLLKTTREHNDIVQLNQAYVELQSDITMSISL